MTRDNAEYKALERFVTADKRYRLFIYALSLIFFIFVIFGGYSVQQSIEHKIDGLVAGSVARGDTRAKEQQTIAKETIRYTTCIIVIPIEQRTEDTQQRCFEAADLPGGLDRSDFSPVVIPKVALSGASTGAIGHQSSQVTSSSSPNPTIEMAPQPSNNPQSSAVTPTQPPIQQQDLLGRIISPISNIIGSI